MIGAECLRPAPERLITARLSSRKRNFVFLKNYMMPCHGIQCRKHMRRDCVPHVPSALQFQRHC